MSPPHDPDVEAVLRIVFEDALAEGRARIRVHRDSESVQRFVDELLVDGVYYGDGVTLVHDKHRDVVVEVYEP